MSKKQALYKQMGLCRRCGKEPLPGKTRCLKCNEDHLQYSAKAKRKAVSNGLCRYCLVAPIAAHKSMCLDCLKKHRDKGKQRAEAARKLCIENYGGRCKCCGISNQKYLQLDHVNNDGAVHRKELSGKRGGNIYFWAVKNNYPDRLQLLCANCHQAKTLFGGCTEDDHESCKVSKDNELPLE